MLRLRTLGGLSLDGNEGPPITAGTQRRRLALLALLASAGERGVRRDKLIAYLWPEADPDRARHALTEMLGAMRKDLAADALFHGTDDVRLDPALCTSDVSEFENALERRELGPAVALYGGPFLEGFSLPDAAEFQRWADRERLRLEQRYRGALEALADDAKSSGEPRAAARWWQRLAEVDPLSTHVALEVMQALAAAGDRDAALAHAASHERRIREEFGAAPNQAVRALAEKLRADAAYAPAPAPRASAPIRRTSGRHIAAPSIADLAADSEMPMSSSRERGATIAGRYLIQRELGRGGMATVYLAHDLKFDRDVALKFIHAEFADAFGTERFQSEIAVLAKLQHPHILPLYDSGEVEGALFYVMPYVGGESLRDRLQREAQLPIAEALRLAREVAGALAYAHAQGVIHRDIKPENILLSNGHALVADFGIARAVSRAAGRRHTEDGFAVGTPAYMSPEQASGDAIDGRSDEYALACVLYEMLGGAPPFVGASGRSVIAQRFTEEPRPVRKLRATVPAEVDAALQKALARIPADRHATVGDFARALDVMDTLGRPRAVRPGLAGTLARWKWAIAAAGAAALGAILFGFNPTLVPDRYVVLPFQHADSGAPQLVSGGNCERLVYDAFGRWRDLKVVDDARTRGLAPATLDQAIETARALHAGRLVWGNVFTFGDSVHVHGVVYDVARVTPLAQANVAFDRSLKDAQAKFTLLADSLLLPQAGAPSAGALLGGTHSVAALRAYAAAHDSLQRWDLPAAERLFRTAAADDPDYANAAFWLAQTGAWLGDRATGDWRTSAERAARLSARLSVRDSALAAALAAMAAGRYGDACARYDALIRRDSMDFAAWFGLSECRAADSAVVRDAASASGWRFRTPYDGAIAARLHALEIVPASYRIYAGVAVRDLAEFLFTSPNQLRAGVDSAGRPYAAWAAREARALAFTPYPYPAIASGGARTPASHGDAVDAQRRQLLDVATRWVDLYPNEAAAWETLALALEMTGRLRGEGNARQSALGAIARARALATDPAEARRDAMTQTRLRLLAGDWAGARELADSILDAAGDPTAGVADEVKPLAALTGRAALAVDLLRRAAPGFRVRTATGRIVEPALPVAEGARQLMGYASLGAPADSLKALTERTRAAVAASEAPEERAAVRDAVLEEPLLLSYPVDPQLSVSRAASPDDPWLAMQRAALRHDTSAVRAGLASLDAMRGPLVAGELDPWIVYTDAWLALAVGDSAGAIARLDRSLDALPQAGPVVLMFVQDAAFLVRMMALRAQLAEAKGDHAAARRWAAAVAALWSGADRSLQPTVLAMRALAENGRR